MTAGRRLAATALRSVGTGVKTGGAASCGGGGGGMGAAMAQQQRLSLPAALHTSAPCLHRHPAYYSGGGYYAGFYGGAASGGGLESMTMHGTTILCVRKGSKVVMMGDGQVSQGYTVVKPNAKKVRRIGSDIIAGFAGSTADCFTLMERLERKLEEHPGQLTRACVDLAKAWRTDKYLRRLEASLLVADATVSFEITGLGDVLEPKDGVISIGSGGTYALAAAKALMDRDDMDAEQVAMRAMTIAAEICVFTNSEFVVEVIDSASKEDKEGEEKKKED